MEIFFVFEETEYCYRGNLKQLYCYQINKIKAETVDTTVKIKNKQLKQNWQSLLRWHFIWSKFMDKKIRNFNFINFFCSYNY